MHHGHDDVAQPSHRRRRIVRVAANLLILCGAILLGSSIVAATRAQDNRASDVPVASQRAALVPVASATVQSDAPDTEPAWASSPTPDQRQTAPRQLKSTPVPDPRPLQLPHFGEGLLEPLAVVKQSTSPYAQNVAGRRAIHVSVPAVAIDADIVEVEPVAVQSDQQTMFEWPVADWAAGHHSTSANPGEGGNIVIAGHDDVRGEVFRGLHDVKVGDQVIVSTDAASYTYVVQEIHMRLYANESLEEQLSVGAFIEPMPEERLTLVTCWPYQVDTHRLIVVAKPAG
jgi:sortase A